MKTDKFKVKVIKLDDQVPGDQCLTIGNVYDAWDESFGMVNIIDDNGLESALFDGEWERVNVE